MKNNSAKKSRHILKKIIIVFLILIIIVLGAGGIFYIKNKSTVDAYFLSKKYSSEQLKENSDNAGKAFDKVLKDNLKNLPREITKEEQLEIDSGKTTLNDVVSKIYAEQREKEAKEAEEKKQSQQVQTEQPKSQAQQQNGSEEDVDKKISEYIGKMYSLESNFQGQLQGLIAQGKSEYAQLVKSGNTNAKAIIASKYAGLIGSLEGSCDASVNSVISEFKAYLTAHGRSTSTATALYNAYLNKKLSAKAYYMSKL